MTLLEIIQRACVRTALPKPATATGSTDAKTIQMVGLLEECISDLVSRHQWQATSRIIEFIPLQSEDQGLIDSIANGFSYFRQGTLYDKTSMLPILPVSDQEWAEIKATNAISQHYRYRISGNHLLINPVPSVNSTFYAEFQTKYGILDRDGITAKRYFDHDLDNVLVPDELCLLGLRWRWFRENGLSYAEIFNEFEFQVKDAISRDRQNKTLYLDESSRSKHPGVIVPDMV